MIGLLAAAAAAVGLGARQLADERLVDRSLRTRTDIQNVLTFLLDAETGVRGYALTGRPEYLDPFRETRQTLSLDLTELRDLVADDPQLSYLAEQVVDQAGRQFLTLNELRKLNLGPKVQPQREELLREGNAYMESLRALLGKMRGIENHLFAQAEARSDRAKTLTFLAVGVSLLFGLAGGIAATVVFTRGVARRVRRVEENAARLAASEPLFALPSGRDEIGRLGTALEETAELLSQRERDLRESEEKFRLLADAADDIITRSRLDPEAAVEYISPAIERILGYTPEELISNPDLTEELIHPDDRHLMEEFAAHPEQMAGSLTLRAIRKDGRVVWLETQAGTRRPSNPSPGTSRNGSGPRKRNEG
jgi:PAS domain S-box-containing protein